MEHWTGLVSLIWSWDEIEHNTYNHREVDGMHGVYREYLVVLSKIIFYLFQDGRRLLGCMFIIIISFRVSGLPLARQEPK